jgi:Fe-S-cluster containining protein
MSDVCAGCGRCCSEQGTPPMMPDEYDALPDALKWDRKAHGRRYDDGLPCLWYDAEARRCVNHAYRPGVCRAFQPGEPACNRWRVELGLARLPDVPEGYFRG